MSTNFGWAPARASSSRTPAQWPLSVRSIAGIANSRAVLRRRSIRIGAICGSILSTAAPIHSNGLAPSWMVRRSMMRPTRPWSRASMMRRASVVKMPRKRSRSMFSTGCARHQANASSMVIGALSEDSGKDRVHMLGVIGEIEALLDLRRLQLRRHLGVGFQLGQEVLALQPYFHRVALDQLVGLLAADARLGQRQQHALGMDQAAIGLEILRHRFGIDDQFLDHAGEARQGEIER